MLNKQLAKNISQAYIMSKYLAELCKQIGARAYLTSPIRLEHGTGTGFFGISNTGSTDCIKERFRGVTDNLGQKYSCWEKIDFVSESCLSITSKPDFRNTYRVEHTREVIDLFREFEKEYIIGGKPFTANDLGIWIVEHQVVCLIEQWEQKDQSHYNDFKPFTKYANPIFYKGTNISEYNLDQLKDLNRTRFATQLKEIKEYNFSKLNDEHTTNLLTKNKKHTLPPMTIAVKFYNDQYELLDRHYRHKLNKRTNPADKKWFNAEDTAMFNEWKKAH